MQEQLTKISWKIRLLLRFTLIELLVVITVIMSLVAMLLPVLGRVKRRAQVVVCMSNMKQIATAGHMYVGDNDKTLPGRRVHGGLGAQTYPMYAYVGRKGIQTNYQYSAKYRMTNPYLGDESDDGVKVSHCPLDRAPLSSAYAGTSHYESTGSSYAGNARHLGCRDLATGYDRGIRLTKVKTAFSRMVFLTEVNGWHWARGYSGSWSTSWHSIAKFSTAFLDGHATEEKLSFGSPNIDDYAFDRDQ